MFSQILNKEIKPTTKIMVVSDIHLQLPVTNELSVIQASLVSRINELGKNKDALLVLNGDVIELWEAHGQSIREILEGFPLLLESIQKFVTKKGHSVVYTVGNHDDVLARSEGDRKVLTKYWEVELCRTLDISMGKRKIRIEHGHENDPYNATSTNSDPHGKRLVESTLPKLLKNMPSLFVGIGDVVNRSLLPCFVLSNLAYKFIFPIAVPIVAVLLGVLTYVLNDNRIMIAYALVVLAIWVILLLTDLLVRFIAEHALGGGSKYMNRVDKYMDSEKINVLIYGHTHQGIVEKRNGYIYANGGCNDVIAVPSIGWAGLVKFTRYVQLSNILVDPTKKDYVKYHAQIIPLVE